jgi:hypothetical protein
MAGFNDITTGSQKIGFLAGGMKLEFHNIDPSNEVDSGFTIPSTLVGLDGFIGQGAFSITGCVSGGSASFVTNVSLCAGPLLEVSLADASDDTLDDENSRCLLIAWGW